MLLHLITSWALAGEPANIQVAVAPSGGSRPYKGAVVDLPEVPGGDYVQKWRRNGQDYTLWARVVPGERCGWLHAGVVEGDLTSGQAPQVITSVACDGGRKLGRNSVDLGGGLTVLLVVDQMAGPSAHEAPADD